MPNLTLAELEKETKSLSRTEKIILIEKLAHSLAELEIQNDRQNSFDNGKDGDEGLIWKFGSMKGKIWMSDDFDEPLEDFKEYME